MSFIILHFLFPRLHPFPFPFAGLAL
jgi:hypothetical protein